MGRYGECFYSAGMLRAIAVNLGQDDAERYPFIRTYTPDCHVQFHNPTGRFQISVPQIDNRVVLASVNCEIHRCGTWFRCDGDSAVDFYRWIRKCDRVSLCVRVGDRLVHRFGAGTLGNMPDIELKSWEFSTAA